MQKPKILFTTPILHYPSIGGPHLHIKNSLKALSLVAEVYLYSRISKDEIGGQKAINYYQHFCKKIYFPPFGRIFPTNISNIVTNKIFRKKFFPPHSEDILIYRDILKIAQSLKVDLIWLGFGNISYPLLEFLKTNSKYKVILQTDSVWSRYILRALPYKNDRAELKRIKNEGKAKEKEERRGAKIADVTTAVSKIDAKYYQEFVKDSSRVRIFSNVIDLDDYRHPATKSLRKPAILLGGTFFAGGPMEDAAKWFVADIWPLIKKEISEVHLYIVGRGSDKVLKIIKDNNIFIAGQVESVTAYLKGSDISIVPLRFESGTRFKILEAGACKIPVVSTSLGCEGLEINNKRNILIADTKTKFAQACIKLLKDKKNSDLISNNLFKLVEKKYTIKNLAKEAKEIINYLDGKN